MHQQCMASVYVARLPRAELRCSHHGVARLTIAICALSVIVFSGIHGKKINSSKSNK